MRLVVGIVILVIGLVLLVGGISSPPLRPLIGTGVGFAVIGLACAALGYFVKPPDLDAGDTQPMSFPARLANIFFEPARVFQNLRFYPRWLDAMLVISLAMGIYGFAFVSRMTPEVIANTITERTVQTTEGFTQQPLPAEAKNQIREDQLKSFKSPAGRASQFLGAFTINGIMALLCAALFTVLALAFGGKINFWQSMAVTAYSWLPVEIIRAIVNLITLLIKPVDDISPVRGLNGLATTDLGSLLINPAESPVIFTFLGLFGLFSLYQLWLQATGLKNGATKLSGGAAWGIALTLFIVIGVCKLIAAKLFSGFVA
jgi:hypothetical protein